VLNLERDKYGGISTLSTSPRQRSIAAAPLRYLKIYSTIDVTLAWRTARKIRSYIPGFQTGRGVRIGRRVRGAGSLDSRVVCTTALGMGIARSRVDWRAGCGGEGPRFSRANPCEVEDLGGVSYAHECAT